jgi:hypothetical protein
MWEDMWRIISTMKGLADLHVNIYEELYYPLLAVLLSPLNIDQVENFVVKLSWETRPETVFLRSFRLERSDPGENTELAFAVTHSQHLRSVSQVWLYSPTHYVGSSIANSVLLFIYLTLT